MCRTCTSEKNKSWKFSKRGCSTWASTAKSGRLRMKLHSFSLTSLSLKIRKRLKTWRLLNIKTRWNNRNIFKIRFCKLSLILKNKRSCLSFRALKWFRMINLIVCRRLIKRFQNISMGRKLFTIGIFKRVYIRKKLIKGCWKGSLSSKRFLNFW